MATLAQEPTLVAEGPEPEQHAEPSGIIKWLTSTDHKVIGMSYTITSLVMFFIAGALAELIRAQLSAPGLHILTERQYNEVFTMHGSLMVYLFAGPFAFGGLANFVVPLQVGAPDMAFPRLNALSYWLYLTGSLIMLAGVLTTGGGADFGWVAYAPLSNILNSPGPGADLWIIALILTGFSAIFTGVNLVTTIFYLRAPGMTMFRLPMFSWNMLVTGILILIVFPVLTGALVMLFCDRHFGTHIFEVGQTAATTGSPLLWQHLFWFWGHPEVYILALPYFGMLTDIIPVFSKKPLFGYKGMVGATIAIAGLSTGVWAHHMFTTGAVLLPYFSIMSYLIAVPTGIKFFNWIGTMWRGKIQFKTPMLHAVAFMVVFLLGGLSGIILASPPLDFATHDTYFVVAHFHNVLFATAVLAGFAGFYFWFPKATGRMMREWLGNLSLAFFVVGFFLAFVPQYQLGLLGMPRRMATYYSWEGFSGLNFVSTVGAWLLGVGALIFLVNVIISYVAPKEWAGNNPWDAHTLEWFTTSPPPPHNYHKIPRIRSERPTWDYFHPEYPVIDRNGHKGNGVAVKANGARNPAGTDAGVARSPRPERDGR
jgi:cytochrome c oxidase subunit 1